MARTLAEIMAGLNAEYDPQKQAIAAQQAQLPGMQQAELAGLDTAKTNAFGGIVNDANARGVVYSGAPIAEENRYVGEKYLPARAAVGANYSDRAFKLQDALAQVNQSQSARADATRNAELQLDLQKAAAARTAAANSGLSLLGGLGSPTAAAQQPVSVLDHFNADLQNLLPADYNQRFGTGYTERLIQRLQAAYPELKNVGQLVYNYRKPFETASSGGPKPVAGPAPKPVVRGGSW